MSGHYHDPLGTYDYCNDPRCPRADLPADRNKQGKRTTMPERDGTRIRHIPYAYPDGAGFGDHYVTRDPSLGTADQFDITVFPRGNSTAPAGSPLNTTPHIRIRTWDGEAWQDISFTPIAKG
jgi:hypothetical protein